MAGLRKILHVEKNSFQSADHDHESLAQASRSMAEGPSPDAALPRLPQMDNQTFLGIEKQFEELHDQFQTRPSRSLSSRCYKYIEAKAAPLRTKRHVDVLEAIFSAHRDRVSTPVTPTSLYNEDIADRNLHERMGSSSNRYARIVSAIYQEDVADRNIRVNGCNVANGAASRYNRRLRKMRSGEEQSLSLPRSKSQLTGHSYTYVESRTPLRFISSDQDLRNVPVVGDDRAYLTVGTNYTSLRPQCSAPSLSVSSKDGRNKPLPPSPSSYEESGANTPSTTHVEGRPTIAKEENHSKDKPPPANIKPGTQSINRLLSPNSTRSSSKRNIHHLSINTNLAAPRKSFMKVAPRPAELQVPTPRREPSSSLEIVNSPVSVTTPARGSGSPVPPKPSVAEEIMDLFKQAYQTTQSMNPHPTFETLQDAIVREINSHDAFQQIHSNASTLNAPELSPDSASDGFSESREERDVMSRPSSRRSLKARHGGRWSVRGQRRNSDVQGRELSFAALKGIESGHHYSKKRRHTYAQPPSFDLDQSHREKQEEEIRGRPSNKRHSDIIPYSDRPHSSHSFFSKAVSAIFEPIPNQSRRSRSRMSLRSPPRAAKRLSKQPVDSSINIISREDESRPQQQQQQQPPPAIQVNHVETMAMIPAVSASTPASPIMSKSTPVASPVGRKNTKARRTMWSTTPMSSAGRKKIPSRNSSVKTDLYDSGRFAV